MSCHADNTHMNNVAGIIKKIEANGYKDIAELIEGDHDLFLIISALKVTERSLLIRALVELGWKVKIKLGVPVGIKNLIRAVSPDKLVKAFKKNGYSTRKDFKNHPMKNTLDDYRVLKLFQEKRKPSCVKKDFKILEIAGYSDEEIAESLLSTNRIVNLYVDLAGSGRISKDRLERIVDLLIHDLKSGKRLYAKTSIDALERYKKAFSDNKIVLQEIYSYYEKYEKASGLYKTEFMNRHKNGLAYTRATGNWQNMIAYFRIRRGDLVRLVHSKDLQADKGVSYFEPWLWSEERALSFITFFKISERDLGKFPGLETMLRHRGFYKNIFGKPNFEWLIEEFGNEIFIRKEKKKTSKKNAKIKSIAA